MTKKTNKTMKYDYLTSCCRVCLMQEEVMIYIYDTVEEFNKTLSTLLESCGDLKIESADNYSKLICEDCARELIIAAKFREKCQAAKQMLNDYVTKTDYNITHPIGLQKFKQKNNLLISPTSVASTINLTKLSIDNQIKENTNTIDLSDNGILSSGDNNINMDKKDKYPISIKNEMIDDGTYEEVEYLDSNIIEIYSIDNGRGTIKTIRTYGDNENVDDVNVDDDPNNSTLLDEIIEENIDENDDIDNDEQQQNNEKIHKRHWKRKYETIIIDNSDNNNDDNDDNDDGHTNMEEDPTIEGYKKNKSMQEVAKVIINHTCSNCGAGFAHLNNLERHVQLTHQDDDVIAMFVCNKCSMTFLDRNSYAQHLNSHQTQPVNDDSSSTKSNAGVATNGKKSKNECVYCGKFFASKSLLLTHERVHTGERPYKCSFCDKKFTTQGGLDLHTRRHEGRKPFACTYCNKRFVESSNLKVHLRIHTGEKPHQCNRCDKSFSRVFLLQIHQRTHTGERPYSCPICKKAFAQQGDLAAHKRIHTGERPHICHICHKGFIKSSGLTSHMRRHEKCDNVTIDNIIVDDSGGGGGGGGSGIDDDNNQDNAGVDADDVISTILTQQISFTNDKLNDESEFCELYVDNVATVDNDDGIIAKDDI